MSYKNNAISSDDPKAIEKLTEKLNKCETEQEFMKKVNSYYKKNGTCVGCEGVSDELAAMQMDATLEISSVVTSSAGCSSPNWRLPISRMATTTARYTSTVRTTEEIIPEPPHKFPQRRPHYPA